jgi:pilus assembly protein CpaB
LLVSCVLSGICTYLLGRKIAHASPTGGPSLRYVAPARAIESGEVLQAGDLAWSTWPVDRPLKGALDRSERALGRTVLYPLEAGQPILERDLADAGSGGGLAGHIPQGMRALSLRTDDVVGVSGFVTPGSRLDVLVTYRVRNSEDPVTATVLEDAEVLAAGQRLQPDPTGKPDNATVVTLLLTPQEAERAVLASTLGTVHFVLRNGSDQDKAIELPVSLSRLSNSDLKAENAFNARPRRGSADASKAPRAGREVVETVLGGEQPAESKQP